MMRSFLFVPGDRPDRIAKAGTRGADAIILDLEDAVADTAKPAARAALKASAETIRATGTAVALRINAPWRLALADIDAALEAGIDLLVVPKVADAARLAVLSEMIGDGPARLIALIESPAALPHLPAITAMERVAGLALGSEDFSLELGAPPTPRSLDLPCRLIALAAASRRLMALGLPLSLAEYRDLAAYGAAADDARAVGMTGALCIHPDQVAVINRAWRPDAAALNKARSVLTAWDEAQARGDVVIALDGRMIDLPVVERARRLLQNN
ncbi:HpcH/HpaI aldolase/citrate lyase family protein [Niveispirillum sp. KHB5.9]|uniref:HpcH/HpaI aldolase/citrate lyase family protein n=1 Tax=Niveispirillum sp. KHB5.9 TaxID=3400269 RepID=UPI003A835515